MNTNPRWAYGDAWERFPIQEGEVWRAGLGTVAVGNLFNGLPDFMLNHDMLIVDPPWNLGNINSFYTKAGRTDRQTNYFHFLDALFAAIAAVNPRTCYIEIGRQYADEVAGRLSRVKVWNSEQRWNVVYYGKNPCMWLRASVDGPTTMNYSGLDEMRCIQLAVQSEEACRSVCDPCMGRGAVGLAAEAAGKRWAGTELNQRRIAVLMAGVDKMGGTVVRIHPSQSVPEAV